MKRYLLAVALGSLLPIVAALYLGGEAVAQAGLRLAAIEQGFALASRHWQFEATPEHETSTVQLDPVPSKPAKKLARR